MGEDIDLLILSLTLNILTHALNLGVKKLIVLHLFLTIQSNT